jgi:tol-pal system protein YbgF
MRPEQKLLITAALVAVAGCTSLSPTEDPVYLRLTDIEARLIRIERVFDNESLLQIANQLDQLQSEAQSLRGEVETLRFESESQASRQRELYLDVDRRLQVLESGRGAGFAPPGGFGGADDGFGGEPFPPLGPASGAGVSPGGAGGPGGLPGIAGSDQEAYDAAFDLLLALQYEPAANAFVRFLNDYPNSRFASNAQYWLAETYYVRRDFTGALPHFQRVLDQYPQSDKIPDALLKIGFCNYELRRWDAARTALQRVTREYPGTTSAQLATQRLQLIAQEVG